VSWYHARGSPVGDILGGKLGLMIDSDLYYKGFQSFGSSIASKGLKKKKKCLLTDLEYFI
jgi:hypothetical protein